MWSWPCLVGLGPVNAEEGTDRFQFLVGGLSEPDLFRRGVRELFGAGMWAAWMEYDRCIAGCRAFSPLSSRLAEVLHQRFFKFCKFAVATFMKTEEPLWGPHVKRSLLRVKLNDVSEELNVVEIASKFHLDRDDTMATLCGLGEDVSLETFLRKVQLFAGETADSLAMTTSEFMDHRTMLAREGDLTPAPQRSVKLWFRVGGERLKWLVEVKFLEIGW